MLMSRRRFVRVATLTVFATLAGACTKRTTAPPSPPPPSPTPARTIAPQYQNEPPILRERVAKETLPTMRERLPEEPLILEPNAQNGIYGGDLQCAFPLRLDVTEAGNVHVSHWNTQVGSGSSLGTELEDLNTQHLLAFTQDVTVRPNLAESWALNADATEFTLNLRKGLRWSDGTLFTSGDVRYYVQHRPGVSVPDDRLLTPDDYTVIIRTKSAVPDAPTSFALYDYYWPEHYLAPYNPETGNIDAFYQLVEEQRWQQADKTMVTRQDVREYVSHLRDEGGMGELLERLDKDMQEYWADLFSLKASWQHNPHLPVLNPWRLGSEVDYATFVLQRNPYFWQADGAGKQLPYVDRIVFRGYESRNELQTLVHGGKVDYQSLGFTLADYAWLHDGQTDGGYSIRTSPSTWHATLHLNLSTTDERLHRFFNSLQVRQAFMHAIDREELNRLYYEGLCTPRQLSPVEGSRYFHEQLSTAHTDHDPARSSRLLDSAGYARRDRDDSRLHPDGTRIAFQIVGTTQAGTAADECIIHIIRYLSDLGLEIDYRRLDTVDFARQYADNKIQAAWMPDYSFPTILWRALPLLTGYGIHLQAWASGYGFFWYPGTKGIEPPHDHWIRDLWDLSASIQSELDEAKRDARFMRMLDIWADQVPLIGVLGQAAQPQVIARDLRNYREGLPYDPEIGGMHLQGPQQIYWADPSQHVCDLD